MENADDGGLDLGEDGGLEVLDAIEGADIPIATAEPTSAGQAGDPLEVLYKHHPETLLDYAEAIAPRIPLQQVIPEQFSQEGGGTETESDPNHRSQPFLSVYERTKVLGFRANQLAQGARPYVVVPEHITRTTDIARLELEQRRLPYILKRPMPNGTFEYWRLSDLMIL
jgi:DNA-directed RNA polymerase I, II, and III subunit RPABC2